MRKLYLGVLIVAMCGSLIGCGKSDGNGGSSDSAKKGNDSKTEATTEAPTKPSLTPSKAEGYMLPYTEGIDSGEYTYFVMEDGNAVIYSYRGEEESLVIPDKIDDVTVTALNNRAFKYGDVLKEITIPATVTAIYGNPFAECDYLETIKVADGNKDFTVMDGCLVKKDGMVLVSFPSNGGKVGNGELTIPEGILKIGDWSFSDVYSVSSIIMPESLVEVDDHAFIRSSVGAVTLNNKLEKIGDYGFAYCAFTGLALPESLKSIGEMAFSGNYLTELVLPDSLETLSYNAFNNSSKL